MSLRLRWNVEIFLEGHPIKAASGQASSDLVPGDTDLAKQIDGMVEQAVWAISKAFPKGEG